MGTIRRMSEQLANMIAAGEVIERPASVVKELLENAIDANSTTIEVHLQDSGIRQIKVIDNGDGMSEEDASLAFERHATSKVKSQYDIFRIQTLGFRGEALPSIASVSDVHVRTSDGVKSGVHLNIKGGVVQVSEPGVMRKGTEVEVNQLFYNTPARLKHIKSLNTELSHITDYINKIALSHPQVAIKLFNNQRLLFQTNGQNSLQSVIASIYSFDIAKKMIEFQAVNDDFKIFGYMSNPVINRASRNYVTIIVNGRAIRNYPLTRVILEVYHTFLPKDKYPLVVLNIELDPVLVDVNVHPAKLEVRFSKEEALKTFIYNELIKVLHQVEYIPKAEIKTPLPKERVQVQALPLQETSRPNFPSKPSPKVRTEQEFTVAETSSPLPLKRQISQVPLEKSVAAKELTITAPAKEVSSTSSFELYYIGQLHGTYLLAQNEEGLFIIDQHAAMERVEYEKNYRLLREVNGDCVELLVPLVLKYPANELLLLKEFLPNLTTFGFEIEEFGGQSLVVRTVPVWAQSLDAKVIIETILQQVITNRVVDIGKIREAVAITMSCKGSIKANQYINEYEITGLLQSLCSCSQPYTCPHGRPIIVKLTKYEIEKLFKRVM